MNMGLVITIVVVGLIIWMIKKNMNKSESQIKPVVRPTKTEETPKVADLKKNGTAAPVARKDKTEVPKFPLDE